MYNVFNSTVILVFINVSDSIILLCYINIYCFFDFLLYALVRLTNERNEITKRNNLPLIISKPSTSLRTPDNNSRQ